MSSPAAAADLPTAWENIPSTCLTLESPLGTNKPNKPERCGVTSQPWATPELSVFHALTASTAPPALAADHSVRAEACHISGKEHTFVSLHSPLLSSNLFSFHFPRFVSSYLTPCMTFSLPTSSSNRNRSHSTHQPSSRMLGFCQVSFQQLLQPSELQSKG